MAETTQGTAHLHGIGATLTNATIASIDLEESFGLDQYTPDETGVDIENRMDNRILSGTVTLYLKTGFSFFRAGAILTLAGLADTTHNDDYVIKKPGVAYKAGDKIMLTLQIENREGIDYA